MTQKTLTEYWELFSAEVIPEDASGIQRQEMRKAFHAGAHAIFCGMIVLMEPGKNGAFLNPEKLKAIGLELKELAGKLYG